MGHMSHSGDHTTARHDGRGEPAPPWRTIAVSDEETTAWVGSDHSDRFSVYTRGNAGEVYPAVFTPLTYSIAAESGERAMRNAILASGLVQPDELATIAPSVAIGSGVFGGYAYLNLSIQRLASARFPGGKPTDADVAYLGVGEEPPPHRPIEGERNIRASIAGVRYLWRTTRTTELPELAADQARVDAWLAALPDTASADNESLRAASAEDLETLFAELFETHLRISFAAGLMVNVLANLCEKLLDDSAVAYQLLAGLGDVDSAAPSAAIWRLSRLVNDDPAVRAHFDQGVAGLAGRLREDPAAAAFSTAFAGFLNDFGSRGPNEWDTAFDTWETDPSLALTLIDRMRAADDSHDPTTQLASLKTDSAALETATLAKVSRPMRRIFRRVLAAARLYSRSRERTKTTVVRAIHGARLLSQELDRRLVEQATADGVTTAARGDLWFLISDELDAYLADPAAFADTIAERRATHARLSERVPPFFLSGPPPPLETWERRDETKTQVAVGDVLTGLPGCLGVARGRARVVTDPSDPRGLEPGDVLIAPLTDPSWTPLFVPAEAVIVDVGAVMSHAVIVSRELGIPCAVSVTDATRRIPDGALIEVNGDTGTVTILDLR